MIPHGVEVFVGLDPIDLRWGFERLSGVVAEKLGRIARSGALFVFFGKPTGGGFGLSVKLPQSRTFALGLDWTEPTGYGLGKAGWVTATFPPSARPPLGVLPHCLIAMTIATINSATHHPCVETKA